MKIESILVVDDDPICCYLHRVNISKIDKEIKVTVCANGQEAIEYLNNSSLNDLTLPSIILLDIQMPVLDGFGFLSILVRYPEFLKIPIIIVSSSCAGADMEKIKDIGNYLCLCKPLSHTELLEAINHSLQSWSLISIQENHF